MLQLEDVVVAEHGGVGDPLRLALQADGVVLGHLGLQRRVEGLRADPAVDLLCEDLDLGGRGRGRARKMGQAFILKDW